MGLKLRSFIGFLLILSVVLLTLDPNSAEAARRRHKVRHAQPDRFAEIVIEASTGYVLSERNADKRLYPASLSKMMTLYLTFGAMERGALSKNDYITVSKKASMQEPSSLGLRPGDTIRVEDAILAIATKSANDCAVALAETVGGSEGDFARAMTVKAHQLGMNNTNFVNASGLFKRAQVSSARDMAILAQALIRDYPKYYRYFSTDTFTYDGYTYMNHNKLMSYYEGMDGLKTGYVYASGYNLAASAVRNGTRLIGVVFGGQTARSRNNAMEKLLDQSFARISNIRVASLAKEKRNNPLPSRRPAPFFESDADSADRAVVASVSAPVVDQGDTDVNDAARPASEDAAEGASSVPVAAAKAAKIETAAGKSLWAIQIGTFSNHDVGVKALEDVKNRLPEAAGSIQVIAPLMTNRGLIYRARLSGLGLHNAMTACRTLKDNCLVLAAE